MGAPSWFSTRNLSESVRAETCAAISFCPSYYFTAGPIWARPSFGSRRGLRMLYQTAALTYESTQIPPPSNLIRGIRPCLRAFSLPRGAPLPAAPPCMRQRVRPVTGGNRHDLPVRVRAPHSARRSTFAHLLPMLLLLGIRCDTRPPFNIVPSVNCAPSFVNGI